MAAITRAMPFFSSLNADESMMATFAGVAAGRVCVCARIVNAASATAATTTAMRITFIALYSLNWFGLRRECLVLQGQFTTLDTEDVNRYLRVSILVERNLAGYTGKVF